MTTQSPHPRTIRSFVLREGRLTPGQERAFERHWERLGVVFEGRPLDLPALFGNDRPVYLEIGFGNGDSLVEIAEQHSHNNYLGIEVHRPGVGHLLMKAAARELTNLRVLRHDAVEVLKVGLREGTLEGVFLFFPDPWPKTRHHKRRILQPAFVELIARAICPGGVFHAATDWQDYARQMMEVLSAAPAFENTAGPGHYAPRPEYRPLTKFEQRGLRLGHGVWDLVFRRR